MLVWRRFLLTAAGISLMVRMPLANTIRFALGVFVLALCGATNVASGCPNCKEGLLDNGQTGANLARGFELSIYLMLGAPLLILTTLGFVFYYQIRAAKRRGAYPDMAQLISQAEAKQLPASPV